MLSPQTLDMRQASSIIFIINGKQTFVAENKEDIMISIEIP